VARPEYDGDLHLEVAATRRRSRKLIAIVCAAHVVVLFIIYVAPIVYANSRVASGIACAKHAAVTPPYAIARCIEARGDLWKMRFMPWMRGRVQRGEQRIVMAMASAYAELVPHKGLNDQLARAAVDTYLSAIKLGVDYTTPASWVGMLSDDAMAAVPSHGVPGDWDPILRAQLRLADVAGAAAAARRMGVSPDAEVEARRQLALCVAGDATTDPAACTPTTPRTLTAEAVMPQVIEEVWDARFPLFGPDPHGVGDPTFDSELARALGAMQVGRFDQARLALAATRVGSPERREPVALLGLLDMVRGGTPVAGDTERVLADPAELAAEAARLGGLGLRSAWEITDALLARGIKLADVEAVVFAAFAGPRPFREQIGVFVLLERLATRAGDGERATLWAKRREKLGALYEPRTAARLDTTPF
jgi:hypothetical protein